MLDFIFRFNILNTAFSVIGKEIGEKLGSLGGRWFRCLYIWTLYLFISEWRNNVVYTQVSTVGTVCFLVANGYLAIINHLRKVKYLDLLDINFIRRLASFLVKLSFLVVVWRYVWGPLNAGLKCAGSFFFSANPSWGYTWFIKGLAVLLLCIIVRLCCQSSNAMNTVSSGPRHARHPPPVPQRPPSARIQAMRAKQKAQSSSD